jgi:hypothetical protein
MTNLRHIVRGLIHAPLFTITAVVSCVDPLVALKYE